jgi:hypothetical protein
VCREEFTVPDNGIQQLPKNLLAANFLTVRQLSGTSAEFELCEVCSQDEEAAVRDRTVKMFCVDCQQSMCKLCSQSHSKMRASSHHRLVGKEKQLTGVYSQYHRASCDKHRDKFLEIYCFDCKSVMCTMCCVTQHNAHKCADFSEVADSFRAEMVEVAETINSAIKSLEDKLMTLESAKKCYVNNIQTVEAEICKKAEELKAIIDRHKNQLLDEVAEVKSQRVKEIDDLSCEIVKDKSLLETFEIYCEELLTKGSHSDIIREAEMLHVKASEMLMVDSLQHSLPTLDTADIKFRSSDILLEDANRSNMVGETFKDSALKGPGKISLVLSYST